jgi:heterodisulfide reductase subunit B
MNIEGKKIIWKEYQKEIAADDFFYVRSCVRQSFFPGSETTFLKILRETLGKNISEHPFHTTCTGIGYHSDIVPFETTMTVVARQFALMTESGYQNYVPSCITSFGLYLEVLGTWHHFPEMENKVREKGKYRLVNQFTGAPIRVVEHIGCHYAKMFPSKGVGGAEYPHVLVGMIEDWGGEVIDYPERRHCCGFGFRQYIVKANRGYSIACSQKKFESMKPYKPEAILTNCPGCPFFFDRWQYALSEMEGVTYGEDGQGIPVLTYEELAGLILGYDPWDLGLQTHQVPVEPLLDKMGIPYDPEKKYLGKNGEYLGRPAIPSNLKFCH